MTRRINYLLIGLFIFVTLIGIWQSTASAHPLAGPAGQGRAVTVGFSYWLAVGSLGLLASVLLLRWGKSPE